MKFWYKPNFIAICAVIILSIPAIFSLNSTGFYTSHDGETHTARIAQYYTAIKDGQIPPRFAGTFYNGLGSPIFVFIYPLPYVLGALLHLVGLSFVNSFKLLMALGFIFSGIFSYLMLKDITKSTKGAFLGSIFYIWAPYRLSLIYVRGSISELLAYMFLPLVFFTITKLAKSKKNIWLPLSSICISLLLLSQNLVALISVPLIALYVLSISFKIRSPKFFILSIIAGFWGLALSAFVYLPSILEIDFIKLHQIIKPVYADHFVYLRQLIYSPWGYGFDLSGFADDHLSLQLGLAHILVLALYFVLLMYFLLATILKIKKFSVLSTIEKNEKISLLLFTLIIIIASLLMIKNPLADYLWSEFKIGKYIDIPWRFTGIIIFSISVISAFLVKIIKPTILIFIFVMFVIIANRNHLRINETVQHDDNFFLNYTGTATQYNEFTPKWRSTTRVPVGFDLNTQSKIINGEANVSTVLNKSNTLILDVNVVSSEAKLMINKFYFPKTTIYKNNILMQEEKDYFISNSTNLSLDTQQDTSGLILLPLKYGKQTITLKYEETNLRLISNLISLGALITALGLIAINVKK